MANAHSGVHVLHCCVRAIYCVLLTIVATWICGNGRQCTDDENEQVFCLVYVFCSDLSNLNYLLKYNCIERFY